MDNFENKKVLVIGLARSGFAAVKLLLCLKAKITVSEAKPPEKIKELDFLKANNVRIIQQTDEAIYEPYDLVIKNPGISGELPFVKQLRDRNIPVITEIELAFRVCKPQHFIAITGTNGKTTTTTLIYNVLKKAFPEKSHLSGNIGIPLCETVLENDLLSESGHYIVLEISNFQLLDIVSFRPEIAVIINLAADHLDFHHTEDNYYRAKCRVYENMNADDVFLLNADDEIIEEYTKKYPIKCKTCTYSIKNKADFYADEESIFGHGEEIMPLSEILVPGRHNVQNVLTAAGVADILHIDKNIFRAAVGEFHGVEHRIEFVREIDGVKYYNDSKGTNIDATITALKAFDRPVILIAGGYEKGLSFASLQPYLKNVKKLVTIGACAERMESELNVPYFRANTMDKAVQYAQSIAENGDIVLLSPTTSSFDQYKCFEDRGDDFKNLVNSLKEALNG